MKEETTNNKQIICDHLKIIVDLRGTISKTYCINCGKIFNNFNKPYNALKD